MENDYRVLGPVLVTDPNGNRGAAKIDELGMVSATAVMGKVGSNDGDTLANPTTTFDYNFERYRTTGQPNVVHNAVRETHGNAQTRWLLSYTYLDGLGGELMKKVQAEPGLAPQRDANGVLVKDQNGDLVVTNVSPRWVGTGRVVNDNKGNPVKQYEPFFSATHEYESETELVEWGVTPILRYDPIGRVVRTDLPDGSISRIEFTPWQQLTWDGNDTVLDAGNTWFAARQSNAVPAPSAQDQRAAALTQAHAGTPGIVHFDTLGRPAIGVENNGPGAEYATKAKLDIEGNPLTITDARGNIAAKNIFDMLGRTLYTSSNDAGARWTVTHAVGNPIRGWDSRRHIVTSKYDVLHRRTELWVLEEPDPALPPPQVQPAPKLAERTIYGDGLSTPEATNHRGKVYQSKDGAGVVTNVEYDFKGNLLEAQRQLAAALGGQLDWSLPVTLETDTFVQQTQYDALNRPITMTTPDQSVLRPEYNEAGLLEKVVANIRGAQSATIFVDDIDYDAKGQRERIEYGNGVVTEYEYDELTYRVKRIKTTRSADSVLLQDLRYFYDAVGNIVEMADLAQSSVFHDNAVMDPVWKYEYDAIYRLINATGREHAGQNADIQQDAYGFPLVNAPNPNDLQAMRNYAETYQYDQVGNFIEMIHAAMGGTGSWTRRYNVSTTNNRLLGTSLPTDAPNQFAESYPHDTHGNMQSMPHLDGMEWDFKDQLAHVVKSGAGDVYFTYDASGQRVRKTWVHNGIREERIYLGGFELYRRHENGGVVLERETLHIMDDTRRIAMVETKTIDTSAPNLNVVSRTRYQCSNHLGSATLELNETGQVISYEEYHPYGTSAYRATNGSVEVSAKRYRYTGKERDEETGLYYHGARYYACWLGRWTSADPAGMVDGPNLYRAMRDNPIKLVDPSGTDPALAGNTRTVDERNESYSYRRAEFVGKIQEHTPVVRTPSVSKPTVEQSEFASEWNAELAGFYGNTQAQKEQFPLAYEAALSKHQELRAQGLREEALEAGVSVREIEASHQAIILGNIALIVAPEIGALAGVGEGAGARMATRPPRVVPDFEVDIGAANGPKTIQSPKVLKAQPDVPASIADREFIVDEAGNILPPARPPTPGMGNYGYRASMGPTCSAGRCPQVAQAYIEQHGGFVQQSPAELRAHYWVRTTNGTMYDPTLRDNLAAWDARFDDIPIGKAFFAPTEHAEFIKRIPKGVK